VSRWRDADMAERWVASAWLLTEKHFRRIDGHEHLWALATILGVGKLLPRNRRKWRNMNSAAAPTFNYEWDALPAREGPLRKIRCRCCSIRLLFSSRLENVFSQTSVNRANTLGLIPSCSSNMPSD